jgi:3-deoxy-D-manno-octulosonic-acid transferase
MSVASAVYRAAGAAAVALRVPHVWLRTRPEELRERLGHVPDGGEPRPVWIHAASVGEMGAAEVFVNALRARGDRVVLTSMTRTGKARARSIRPDVGPVHAPLDAPSPVRAFLTHANPSALVVLETEIWPGWIHELGKRGTPWGIASARLSPRSRKRARWTGGVLRDALATACAIAARTEEDADAFRAAGARPEAVLVAGDLKEDRAVPTYEPPESPSVWLAACTRSGEEEVVLNALSVVASSNETGELWLAPRHPERFEEVAALVAKRGWPLRRWAERDRPPTEAWGVVLVDAMGVLDEAYRRSAVAFVGGSLVPLGGHSPWEAAAAGRPVLLGPHTENCARLVERLARDGAALRVRDAEDLTREVTRALRDPEDAARRGRLARESVLRLAGAAERTVAHFRAKGLLS